MICVGVDMGSLFCKAVVLDDDELRGFRIIPTTGTISDEIGLLMEGAVQQAGLSYDRVDRLVGTGKGADLLTDAEFVEDDINCVGVAAGYYLPDIRLVIDVGGQSITSILLDDEGDVTNFMRNDKCASGSGRFLEVMSKKLGLSMDSIDETAQQAASVVEIGSQCAVFAESEVITHLNNGEKVPDIIAGVCGAVAKMVAAQARRFENAGEYTITGGVARLSAVTGVVGKRLGRDPQRFPFDPQLAAAMGAALLGDAE
ncbi:MAG: acyl-CoA dehydratase activase [bacterium]